MNTIDPDQMASNSLAHIWTYAYPCYLYLQTHMFIIRSIIILLVINSPPASGVCCLITFENSLDSDLAGQNVGSDLDPSFVTFW